MRSCAPRGAFRLSRTLVTTRLGCASTSHAVSRSVRCTRTFDGAVPRAVRVRGSLGGPSVGPRWPTRLRRRCAPQVLNRSNRTQERTGGGTVATNRAARCGPQP